MNFFFSFKAISSPLALVRATRKSEKNMLTNKHVLEEKHCYTFSYFYVLAVVVALVAARFRKIT